MPEMPEMHELTQRMLRVWEEKLKPKVPERKGQEATTSSGTDGVEELTLPMLLRDFAL